MDRKRSLIFICFIIFVSCVYFLFFGQNRSFITSQKEENNKEEVITQSVTIITLGDSLTAGYGLPEGESYPRQLEKKLRENGYSVKVINAGVSGETSAGSKERASFIANQNPDIVIFGIGGNDALRFLPLTETKKNIESVVSILQSNTKIKVVLLQMQAPLNMGIEYKTGFDSLYKDIADTYHIPLVPFITTDVFLRNELKLNDGIHLNKDGYKKVVDDYIYPAVKKILDTTTL